MSVLTRTRQLLRGCTSKIANFNLILIRESWAKIQIAGPSPSAFFGKQIQSAALHQSVYVSVLWILSAKRARWRSQKWHTFLFRVAYQICHISPHIGDSNFMKTVILRLINKFLLGIYTAVIDRQSE